MGAAAGEGPADDAWFRLFDFPAGCLLSLVVAVRCLIYVRISMDKDHDGRGVANQLVLQVR